MRIVLTLFLALLPLSALAEGFDDYQEATFASILKDEVADPAVDHDLHPGTQGWIVSATFAGNVREISAPSREHIKMWLKVNGKDAAVAEYFKHEVELQEGDEKYWVPIQEVLVAPLKSELRNGGVARFYLLFVGFAKTAPIFVVNEFVANAG